MAQRVRKPHRGHGALRPSVNSPSDGTLREVPTLFADNYSILEIKSK